MAVEPVHADQRRTGGFGHQHACAKARAGATLDQLFRQRGNVFAHQVWVGLKPAIGDYHGVRCDPFAGVGDNTRDLAVLDDEFLAPDAAPKGAAAFFQIGSQPSQGYVRAAAFPVQPGGAAAWRRHNPTHEFELSALDELRAFLADPGEGARAFFRQQPGMCGGVVFACLSGYRAADVFHILSHVAEGDMDDAAGNARIAEVVSVAALLQHRDLQPKTESAVCSAQPCQPAADDDDLVRHINVLPVSFIAAATYRR